MFVFAALCALAAPNLPIVFLLPGDLHDATNVRIQPQIPEKGMSLLFNNSQPDLWYAPVAAIPEDDSVHIWYQRVCKSEKDYMDQRALCMGELRGETWTLPALDATPPAWGGPNNVVMRRSPHKPTWGGFNVFQIVREASGYRMLYWDQPEPPAEAGAMFANSKDGIHWEKRAGTVFTEHNDAYSLIAKDGSYIVYQTSLEPWPDKPYPDNLDKFKRVLSVRTSPDFITWSPQEIFLRPDKDDAPETEFYLMKVFAYGDGYAGLIMKYYGDPKMPNKHSGIMKYELIVSNDALHWERPYRQTDIGFWSYADPFTIGNGMHFVIWKDGGMNTVMLRMNGLTRVEVTNTGSFTTRPFTMPATGLALNADATNGWIEVSLLDELGRSVGSDDVRIANATDTAIPLPVNSELLNKLAGKSCRLTITLQNAAIYSIECR